MTRNNGSCSASAVAPAGAARPNKSRDDKDFQARWIAFGMSLKGKGDGFGIDWRDKSFEQYIAAVHWAEGWQEEKHGT